ncbi:hypothetical protein GCM10017083_29570 [Thalassobaculum fulvum]|uniref:PAS domain S-box-containing protein/HDIG domain-containing protein n=1 Tax=Thalassobaculum fulvum TaxID=1633335 RepID=A0A919CQ51_9PROT|nr:HD domain-containing phosphohydrolase [Thalassobaculum fulvum]GHD53178.1 hypothetical protein GCM10017083_29570 [Thalassobaculum fulvum]
MQPYGLLGLGRRLIGRAAVVAGVYAVVATVYIVLSDRLLGLLVKDSSRLVEYGTIKGTVFVLVTALGLFATWTYLARREEGERRRRITAQQRLGELANAIPNPLLVLSPEGRHLEWNGALETLTGLGPERLSEATIADLAHADDLAAAAAALGRVVQTGRPDSVDARIITADGSARLYRWHGAAGRDADGRIDRVAVVGVDLTDLKAIQDELQQSVLRAQHLLRQTVAALTVAVEKRGAYTAGHEQRVTALSLAIADEMGLPPEEREGLQYAASLHDIGELAVPADILVRPALLTPSEREIVKSHSDHGYEILRSVSFPWPVADIIRQHHERLDGSGYPCGLKGGEIRREARIIAVADVVEAMCSHRPYRPALGKDAALAEIRDGRATRYDPAVVDACLTVWREGFEFPAVNV